jgi:hypothetical protein
MKLGLLTGDSLYYRLRGTSCKHCSACILHICCTAAGVGITGELPGEGDALPDASSSQVCSSDQAESWQDPTERLALALGLQVTQLAHYTGRVPGNPDGALHRLRYVCWAALWPNDTLLWLLLMLRGAHAGFEKF